MKYWLYLLGALLFCAPPVVTTSYADASEATRVKYRAATAALARGDSAGFRRYRDQLGEYPLYPYLVYAELNRRLPSLPTAAVDDFLKRYGNDLLGLRLRGNWLNTLAAQQRWPDFLRYDLDDEANTGRQCQHAWAQTRTNNTAAGLDLAARLWMSPKSAPEECDRLFSLWYANGNPSRDLAWQRFHLAMGAGNDSLASYLMRYLGKDQTGDAVLYRQVHDNPRLVGRTDRFSVKNPRARQIVEYGLAHLAPHDPRLARTLMTFYVKTGVLGPESERLVAHRIATSLATQSSKEALEWVMALPADAHSDGLDEDMVRFALRTGEWSSINVAVHSLPPRLLETPRWNYWATRARESQGADGADLRDSYVKMRDTRSYYGFLAADRLGASYEMQHKPVDAKGIEVAAARKYPGIQRARELYLLGETADSRREWAHTIGHMSNQERAAAARIAGDWGWYQQSIMALIAAEDWNDLGLRFPMVYTREFTQAAKQNRIDPNWLYAIARQESVFNATIKSPAGAVGLMQLMPATAQLTARKSGIPYRSSGDLLTPATNVVLGGRYMRMMLDSFQQNRVLAAAAYNAGPARVNQWLKRLPDQIEHDMFVEAIPFRETRQYVQNVLSFAVIYAYLQGQSIPLVQPTEKLINNPFKPSA